MKIVLRYASVGICASRIGVSTCHELKYAQTVFVNGPCLEVTGVDGLIEGEGSCVARGVGADDFS